MPLSFTCPNCNYTSLVDDQFVGQSGPCASCGKVVTVESPPPSRTSTRPRGGSGRAIVYALISGVVTVLCLALVIGLVYAALATSDAVRTGTTGNLCETNLQAIGKAMLQYHNDNGRFPPAVVRDAQGRALHSWRVLLLPYLGHNDLFIQYDMSKPWDDPQNQLLATQMPSIYHCPESLNVSNSETSYQVVVGPDAVFQKDNSASLLDLRDGPAQTLLVVETTGNGVLWIEPRDLAVDSMSLSINGAQTVGIGSQHRRSGAHVLLADGSVKFLDSLTSPETLEALLTIDAGDTPAN